jgi:hypothetical protein
LSERETISVAHSERTAEKFYKSKQTIQEGYMDPNLPMRGLPPDQLQRSLIMSAELHFAVGEYP